MSKINSINDGFRCLSAAVVLGALRGIQQDGPDAADEMKWLRGEGVQIYLDCLGMEKGIETAIETAIKSDKPLVARNFFEPIRSRNGRKRKNEIREVSR